MSFIHVSTIHQDLVMKIGGARFRSFIILSRSWKDIVGELFASRSHPYRFTKSILYIAVQNNAWMQELYLRKVDILRQCRSKISEDVKDIIFLIRS